MKTIAFDTDGTLIHITEDVPRYDIIAIFLAFQKLGCKMVIWSGGGIDYATRWRDKLGLTAEVVAKGSFVPDIAFDDEKECVLGKVTIHV